MGISRQREPGILCPHCGEKANVRSSAPVTALCRELYYSCTNFGCGHNFMAQLSIVHSVTPSQRPNPAIVLPVSTGWRAGGATPTRRRQDRLARPAA